MRVRRALVSVSDKRGLPELGCALEALGAEILSTGKTAQALAEAGVRVRKVSDFTGSPEVFGGRVKTLHPRIHGGILFRRDQDGDVRQAEAHGIDPIDLVVVNLYPFEQAVARGAGLEEALENVDIGGPAMLRAAAKNWAHVGVVVDPDDYPAIASELAEGGGLGEATRLKLMRKAFAHTAAYDTAIAAFLARDEAFPQAFAHSARRLFTTRYGENPHQRAALYRDAVEPAEPSVPFAEVLGGKELSYNNLLDLDSALACLKELEEPSCVIVKHNTPCGVARGDDPEAAFRRARACDEVSAFGGIVALNRAVDGPTGRALAEIFLEAVIAPGFAAEAREALLPKKGLRLLAARALGLPRAGWRRGGRELRSVCGGVLVQDRDVRELARQELRVVTRRAPNPDELDDALFAWKVVKHVRSNAVVFARQGQTVGIGGGQTSRVEAVKVARMKAVLGLAGSALASDAFFPFRDGLDEAVKAGATCVIQPGGSVRDAEVVAAADEHGVSMVFTGVRHFRH